MLSKHTASLKGLINESSYKWIWKNRTIRISNFDQNKDIEVIAINDLSNQESLAYLLKYDTIMGRFSGNVNIEKDILHTDNESVQMFSEIDPAALPWGDLNIDIVIESTGVFRTCSALKTHLKLELKK